MYLRRGHELSYASVHVAFKPADTVLSGSEVTKNHMTVGVDKSWDCHGALTIHNDICRRRTIAKFGDSSIPDENYGKGESRLTYSPGHNPSQILEE
jgi:hypothetical protein